MAFTNLKAKYREKTGRSATRKLRARGEVPAILYGEGLDSIPLTIGEGEFKAATHTEAGIHAIVNLEIDGLEKARSETAIIKEVQRHPVKDFYLHVDFFKIALDKKIETAVPVLIVGESPGAKMGGVLQHGLWEVKVECLPGNIPEHFTVDVDKLEIGGTVKVADLAVPEGIELLTSPEEIVVRVVPPTVFKEEEVAAEIPKPEVIGEAKEKEEKEEQPTSEGEKK